MTSVYMECLGAAAMGLFGGVHCIAMCGPLCSVISGPSNNRGVRAALHTLPANLGRVATYTALGALAGGLGAAFRAAIPFEAIGVATRFATALVLVAAGLQLGGFIRGLSSSGGSRLGAWLTALGRRVSLASPATFGGRAVRGLAWGLMPCGMLYGAVGLALASASIPGGALVMATFGLATLPSMVVVGVAATGFARVVKHPALRATAGLMVAASGALHATLGVTGLLEQMHHRETVTTANVPQTPCLCHLRER
ncbi:MAG: sulfite exporter TauE/SafE family protein [Polyangiaceae bacterium]